MTEPTNQNSGPGKDLDNLFREAIGKQEFTPSPRVWRALNWKLLMRELMHLNFTNVPRLAFLSATGGLVIVASLTYLALRTSSPSENQAAAGVQAADKENFAVNAEPVRAAQNSTSLATSNRQAVDKQAETAVPKPSATALKESKGNMTQAARSITQAKSALLAYNKSSATSSASAPSTLVTAREELNAPSPPTNESIRFLDPIDFSGFEMLPSADTISFIRSGEVFSFVRETPRSTSFFSVGAGIAPEMALYRSNGSTTRDYNYWLNTTAAWHFSKFSVRTGIGIGYTYDEGVYKVEYRSNDSVSYFKEVIGYYTDPANPSRIIYITKDRAIYDSVTHMADDRTRNRYTYIQIPLLLGYTILETPRFTLGFEAGPALSLLINEKKAQPIIEIPNGRLILLQDNTPSRLSTNWQLWAKLTIGYQISRNWGLMINPYYKYYLTSPTQAGENGSRSTQAFGLDIGIQYLFGNKARKK